MIQLIGKPAAEVLNKDTSERVAKFKAKHGRAPKLAVVLVGGDPASVIYTGKKGQAATALGIENESHHLPETAKPEELKALAARLNADPKVDGILIQRPLPTGFHENEVVYWVTPEKDVDAFHPANVGKITLGLPGFKPCTPAGIMALLQFHKITIAKRVVCIIGRSATVGRPLGALMLQADATVIQCHSKTLDIRMLCRQADIVVVAAGQAGLVDSSFLTGGATVVDVGIHRKADGTIIGDVNYEDAAPRSKAITPVPGGVGPMTIAMLMQNTVLAAELRAAVKS